MSWLKTIARLIREENEVEGAVIGYCENCGLIFSWVDIPVYGKKIVPQMVVTIDNKTLCIKCYNAAN